MQSKTKAKQSLQSLWEIRKVLSSLFSQQNYFTTYLTVKQTYAKSEEVYYYGKWLILFLLYRCSILTYMKEKLFPLLTWLCYTCPYRLTKLCKHIFISNSKSPHRFLAFCAFSLVNHQFLQLRIVTEQKQVFLAFHVQCCICKYWRKCLYQV